MIRASIVAVCTVSISATFAADPTPVTLTLAEAVAKAQAASARLGQLTELARAADEAHRGVAAQRGPQVDLSGGYTRQSSVPELSLTLPGVGTRTLFPDIPDNFRTRAQVSVPLYTGGRVPQLLLATAGEQQAAARDVEAGRSDLVLETTQAYWSLVTARESERVLREAIVAYDAHVKDAQNRKQFGLAAANEVLAVQVERDQAELARLTAANNAVIAEANLARLLGLPQGAAIATADTLEAPAAARGTKDELIAQALAARPDRAALAERVRAAEARAGAQQSTAKPQVVAAAGYDYARPNRRILPYEESFRGTWDVSVNAQWTVFDSGRTGAAYAEAKARAGAARRALDDLDRRIRLEVTQRLLEAGVADAGVAVTGTSIAAATENRRVAGERYRAGVSPSSELLDAETAFLRAQLSRVDALARRRIAEAAIDRAVGPTSAGR